MTTPPAALDAPFHVTPGVNKYGRVFYVHHCCGKRYVNITQTLLHRQQCHGETKRQAEAVCRDAYAQHRLSCSLPRLRQDYVREVCTCAARQPECPACVEWRRWFGGHPAIAEMQRIDSRVADFDEHAYQERLEAAHAAYGAASHDGNIMEATKQRRRMEHYKHVLKKLRLAQE